MCYSGRCYNENLYGDCTKEKCEDILHVPHTDDWAKDAFNSAQTFGEMLPVFIPSYKRPDQKLFTRLREENIKATIVINNDDYEDYAKWEGIHELVLYNPVNFSLAGKWNFIFSLARERGHRDILFLEDDVEFFNKALIDTTKTGNYRSKQVKISFVEAIKCLQYMKYKIPEKEGMSVAMIGVIHTGSAWPHDIRLEKIRYQMGSAIQAFVVDVEALHTKNILARKDSGWFDFDLNLQCFREGLLSIQMRWLSYSIAPMLTGGKNHSGEYDINSAKEFSRRLLNIWGKKYIRYQVVRGIPNARTNWLQIKKDMRQFGKIFEDTQSGGE